MSCVPSQQQHQRTTAPADQRPHVRLADDQWKDLEDKALMLWKSILAPNKAIILRYSTMQHPDAQTTQQVHFITSQCLGSDAAEFMVSHAASYHLGEHPFPKDAHSKASDATWDASTMTGTHRRQLHRPPTTFPMAIPRLHTPYLSGYDTDGLHPHEQCPLYLVQIAQPSYQCAPAQ
jgi:hypothetical protein